MEGVLPIITVLKKPKASLIFAVTTLVFFGLNYYALANLPASRNFMCLEAGNLTPFGLFFSGLISILIGLLLAGLLELRHQSGAQKSLRIGSASGVGIITGTLTSFCTFCTLPVISLFGVGTFFAFFAEYQLYFRIFSLVILGTALYFLNNQLRRKCHFCVE